MSGGILITGSTGQVGNALCASLAPLTNLVGELHTPTRAALDLSDPASIRAAVRILRPRWIVNPGAYTAVDKAELEPEIANAINVDAPRIFGEEARKIGAAVIHFSTDYVFSGTGDKPYSEEDATGPMSVYGRSKLAGEEALGAATPAHLIFRTSWVYGAAGKNFLLTVLRLARERPQMKIVNDQHGAPTWSHDLARLIAHVILRCESVSSEAHIPIEEAVRRVAGVYHAAGGGETTWHDFAMEAVRQAQKKEPATQFAMLEGIPTSEYPTPARRPHNSRLNCKKLYRTFDYRLPAWEHSLSAVIDELYGS